MNKPKIIVFFLAYNAEKTLENFYKSFPKNFADEIILVDDASKDNTYELAKKLGIISYKNPVNLGYGGNMKKALSIALKRGAEILIDIHPDGEYNPSAIPAALKKVQEGYQLILGNRFTSLLQPIKNGMFIWKLIPLRLLNSIDSLVLGVRLNDFHQGFRVYTKDMLKKVNFEENSNDYLFSFELIAQSIYKKVRTAQVPVETSYQGKKRGASLKNSILYSIGTFKVLALYFLSHLGFQVNIFKDPEKNLQKRIEKLVNP
ncbi:glycosyltransferase family 2 protein [Candidatus Daviesbacteria bacterium]|nr:glycosyltransferase family 2 protein [Candidatus Daviesbacteria bacterium]